MDLSIIIPVYNAEKYLEKCLLSIQNQLLQNFEVIMVNDGSLDNSEIICRNFAKKDKHYHNHVVISFGQSIRYNCLYHNKLYKKRRDH